MADPKENKPNSVDVKHLMDALPLIKEYRDIQQEIGDILAVNLTDASEIANIHRDINKGLWKRIGVQIQIADRIKIEEDKLRQYRDELFREHRPVEQEAARRKVAEQELEVKGYKTIQSSIMGMNKMAMLPYIYLLIKAIGLFTTMDAAAEKFRMTMGATRENVAGIRDMAQKVAVEFMHIGVTIEGAYAAVSALGREMGGIKIVSKDVVATVAILKSQLGIAEEDSAGFLRNMAAVSKTTMASQQDMAYYAQSLAQAAGIPLSDVMKNVAHMSSVTLTMVSKLPNQIIRTAIEARRLNTTLGDMAKASRSLLNFQESVDAEMEASVLIGRGINLQLARELAYKKNLIGSNKEILRITKSVDFENLDVFQQEAFAKATGRSVEELLKMVQAENEWKTARNSTDPLIRKQIEEYDKLLALNEANAKAEGANVGAMVRRYANQQRITSITAKWNQLLARIGEKLLPIIDGILGLVADHFDTIIGLIGSVVALTKIFGWEFTRLSGIITKYSSIFGLGLLNLKGWIPVFGQVIMVAEYLYHLFDRWSKTEFIKGDWLGNIWKGILLVFGPLYDVLVKPFIDALVGIKDWLGFSPSVVGLLIVKGISSIGGMLLTALTSPFKLALSFITTSFTSVFGGLFKLLTSPFRMAGSFILKSFTSVFGGIFEFIGKSIGAVFSGIAKGIASFGDPKVFLGILAIGSLGIAMIPFIYAMKQMTGLDWKGLLIGAGALVAFSAAAFGLGALLTSGIGTVIFGTGLVGIVLLSAALLPFAYSAKKAGDAMVILGTGFTSIVKGFKDLETLSFINTIVQLYNLKTAIKDLSSEIKAMPDVDFGKLFSIEKSAMAAYVPAVTVTPTATTLNPELNKTNTTTKNIKTEPTIDYMTESTGKGIIAAINGLREDLNNGKVAVKMDSQLVSATIDRSTQFMRGYGTNNV